MLILITEKSMPFCIRFQHLVGRDALTLSRPADLMSLALNGTYFVVFGITS